jgi:CheY-like chemotaxis protein
MADVKKVLVVDDHFEMLEFLQSMLELSEYDYEVLAVPSAEEGMLELGRTAFDLLITDVRLPGMSGFDFVRRSRKRSRNPDLPVIMITAYSSDQGRQEAKELGVYRYFTKPFGDTDEVITAVNEILYGAPPAVTETDAPAIAAPRRDITLPANVEKRLRTLTADTGASLVLLATKEGQMLIETGAIRDVDTAHLASIISGNLINSKQLTQQLGGDSVTTIQYHGGEHLEMYTANIGTDYFMSIVFDVQVRRGRFGTIWVFTQRAIKDLLPMLPALPTMDATAGRSEQTAVKQTAVSTPAKPAQPIQKEATPPPPKTSPRSARRRGYLPDSASSTNVEYAAKPHAQAKAEAAKKSDEPTFAAPPPPDFSGGGDADDGAAIDLGIDDLKNLLGNAPATPPSADSGIDSESELVPMNADALKNLLGNAPAPAPSTDSGIESESKLMPMDADALKNLLGNASAKPTPSTDSGIESESELVPMDADALKNLMSGGGAVIPVADEEQDGSHIPPADDLAALLALDNLPDDDAIDFGDTLIPDDDQPTKPMSFAEAKRLGLIGGAIAPASEPEQRSEGSGLDDMLKNLENPVDLDAFWDTAISSTETAKTSGMSLEEARRQGFLSNKTDK